MGTYIVIGILVLVVILLFFRSQGEQNFTNLTVNELSQLLKKKDTVLIDVRTPRETSQGMIGKPLKIELGPGMQQKLSSLNKDKKYIVYCRSGKRSAMASNMMSKMGFQDVNNLEGGYIAWQSSK